MKSYRNNLHASIVDHMTDVKIVNNNASFFQEDPMLINELRDDVRDESSKFGEVKSVKLYDVSLAFCETNAMHVLLSPF